MRRASPTSAAATREIEESGRQATSTRASTTPTRPELFLKDAACRRTVGPGRPIAVRADSTWNVPEPEIGVVLGERGRIAGYTIGNDVSSRDIEGENPLYLPQAKVYAGACALGPAVLVAADDAARSFEIELRIVDARRGASSSQARRSTARMKRGSPSSSPGSSRQPRPAR